MKCSRCNRRKPADDHRTCKPCRTGVGLWMKRNRAHLNEWKRIRRADLKGTP